jgi:predicted ATPase
VRYGRCDEGLAVPFQPFVEALRSAATAIGLHRLRAALGPVAAPLARLWPELEGLGEPPRADPETERYRLFEAVTALLEVVTRERPMLLVVDDLHWATQPTRLMLRHVVRSERPLRALIVAICRETELTADQANPLPAELRRDTGATTVPIGALDKNATATQLEALAGHAPDQRATELVQQLRRRPAAIRPASAN